MTQSRSASTRNYQSNSLTGGLTDFGAPELAQPAGDAAPARGLRRAKILVALVLLAMLATNAWLITEAHTQALQQAQSANTNLARAVADKTETMLQQIEHALSDIVFDLERAPDRARWLADIQPALVHYMATVDAIDALVIVGGDGTPLASTSSQAAAALAGAGTAHHRHHRTDPGTRARLWPPVVASDPAEAFLPVSLRINDAEGDFSGIALATLGTRHLRALLAQYEVGDGAITLVLGDHILARHPHIGVAPERGPATAALRARLAQERSGTGTARSPFDGVERIFSFERGGNHPILVLVAASKAQILRPWQTSSAFLTVWVLLLCALLGLAATQVSRSMRRRLQAEATLRQARDALAAANTRLAQLAQFDALTTLANRRYFDRWLERALRQAQRDRKPLALVMIDVDHFKKFNDRYGHVAGDQCLQRVAAAIRTAARRPEDFVARYGGEEMAIILPRTDDAGALRVAEDAHSAVAALAIPHADAPTGRVTISLGVATCVPDRSTAGSDLVRRADSALYAAKSQGRDRVGAYVAPG